MLRLMRISDDNGKNFGYINVEVSPSEVRRLADVFARLAARENPPPKLQITLGADEVDDASR
jgi:hypothetical protein